LEITELKRRVTASVIDAEVYITVGTDCEFKCIPNNKYMHNQY